MANFRHFAAVVLPMAEAMVATIRRQNCLKMDFEHYWFESFELSLSGLLYSRSTDQVDSSKASQGLATRLWGLPRKPVDF